MILLVLGIALPDYMGFLFRMCRSVRYTKKALEAGAPAKIHYHPRFIQLECGDPAKAVREARTRGLRVYYGRKHITISDGVYTARIYLSSNG